MSSSASSSTLLLPSLPKQALVGIDLLSLTSSPRFKGFSSLPPGWHFLFVGANETLSSRQGLWFYVPGLEAADGGRPQAGKKRQRSDSELLGVRGEVIRRAPAEVSGTSRTWLAVLQWDADAEQLKAVDDAAALDGWRNRLSNAEELRRGLFPYRQSVPPSDRITEVGNGNGADLEPVQDFPSLSRHVSENLLARACGPGAGGFWTLDTASSTVVDAEAEKIPGLSMDDKLLGRPLHLLDIDLKRTWPADATGRERTDAARDRSWRLEEVVRQSTQVSGTAPGMEDGMSVDLGADADDWGVGLLGEFEFCFIMTLCLANWSCLSQWKRLVDLCLTCKVGVATHPRFFRNFLAVLELQLRHTELVDGGLFDVDAEGGNFLKKLLRRFDGFVAELEQEDGADRVLRVRSALERLKKAIYEIWGWDLGESLLKRGTVQLEDGELVELETHENDENDESGEYAPVVVET